MKNPNKIMLLSGVVGLMITAIPPLSAEMGMWLDADANKDGGIDRAEFDARRAAHFKSIDGNGDGLATAEEMKAFHEKQRQAMGESFFKRLDTDGDGKILSAEWQAASLKKFGKLDSSGDDAITADELDKMHGGMGGMSGMGEGTSHGDFKDGLVRFDTDKDGKVSPTEWNAMGDKMFAHMDANKDGKISVEEMPRHGMGKQSQDDATPVQP